MSTMPRLTMIGLYNYDPTIFDNLTLPTGYDNATFIDSFLLEHGEKCVLYPDPDFMKFSIGVVSRKWSLELTRIYEALTAEYNPIENYDRHEKIIADNNTTYGKTNNVDYTETKKPLTTETTTRGTTDSTTYGKTDTTTKGTTDSTTYGKTDTTTRGTTDSTTYGKTDTTTYGKTDTTTQTVAGEEERKVAAFNSSSYEPSEKTISNSGTNTVTQAGTDSVAEGGTDSTSHTGVDSVAQSGTDSTSHTGVDSVAQSGTDSISHTGIDTVAMSGTDTTDVKGKTEGLSGTDYNHLDHDAHIHGNIGVMTASSMVSEIVKQRFKENLYSLAGRIFANELLIQIY